MNSPARKAGGTAFLEERRELTVEFCVYAQVLRAEFVPTGAIAGGVARENRRNLDVLHLEGVTGDDSRPWPAGVLDRRKADDVVLHDHVRVELVEDLTQAVVDVTCAVAERAPGRLDELRELLDSRLAEYGGGVADEVLPELTWLLLGLRWRPEPHESLLEALGFEVAGEGLLDDEDDPMPALAQDLSDPDAVVRRPERPFWEEHDGCPVHRDQPLTHGCFPSKRGVVSLQFSSMNSQTAETERVDVGERLRAIRRLRRVTLKTVADRADLSESFLSQVERGRANASVASLKRIAAALGVNVADLFEPNGSTGRPRVLRREAGRTSRSGRSAGSSCSRLVRSSTCR